MHFSRFVRLLALAYTCQQSTAASAVPTVTATEGDINLDALATINPDGTGAPIGTATAGPSVDLKSLTNAIVAQAQSTSTDLADYVTVPIATATPAALSSSGYSNHSTSLLFNPKYGPAFPTGLPKKVSRRASRILGKRVTYFYDTSKAAVPSGYRSAFTSLSGATQAKGYLTFKTLKTYDTAACATFCTSNKLCTFFNIYYERAPDANRNPIDLIKCSIYSLPQTDTTATNKGQWQGTFQVLITGSNGYNKIAPQVAPAGYSLTDLKNAAINAPTYDKTGGLTALKQVMIDQYSASLCAAACDAQTVLAKASADSTGCATDVCVSANLYILSKNGKPFITVCSLYTTTWDNTYATNSGYADDSGTYVVSNSISITSSANAATYPKVCITCQPQRLIPRTLGGATLASIPAPAVPDQPFGLDYMAVGSFGQCGLGSPLVSTFENTPTDHLAYYAFPESDSVSSGCISQGYIYHVESGLCATQTQVSASAPKWGSDANPGSTTLQPCNIDNPSHASPAQTYCFAKDLDEYYSNFDRFSYRCVTFASGGEDAFGQGWSGMTELGNGKKPKTMQGQRTYEAAVSNEGGWCIWVKIKELPPAEPEIPSDDDNVE